MDINTTFKLATSVGVAKQTRLSFIMQNSNKLRIKLSKMILKRCGYPMEVGCRIPNHTINPRMVSGVTLRFLTPQEIEKSQDLIDAYLQADADHEKLHTMAVAMLNCSNDAATLAMALDGIHGDNLSTDQLDELRSMVGEDLTSRRPLLDKFRQDVLNQSKEIDLMYVLHGGTL